MVGGYTEAMSHAHGNYKVRELGLIQRGVSSIGCWPLCGTLSRCILPLVEHTCNVIICTPVTIQFKQFARLQFDTLFQLQHYCSNSLHT